MVKLLYSAGMSLDGFIAGPGGDMSWLTPYMGPDPALDGLAERIGALLVGRRTWTGDDPRTGGPTRKGRSAARGPALRSSSPGTSRRVSRPSRASRTATTSSRRSSWPRLGRGQRVRQHPGRRGGTELLGGGCSRRGPALDRTDHAGGRRPAVRPPRGWPCTAGAVERLARPRGHHSVVPGPAGLRKRASPRAATSARLGRYNSTGGDWFRLGTIVPGEAGRGSRVNSLTIPGNQ